MRKIIRNSRSLTLLQVATMMCVVSTHTDCAAQQGSQQLKRHGIQFTITDSWHEVETKRHEVLVALRSKLDLYPTFNMIVVPGKYTAFTKSLVDQGKELQNSYTAVGFTDVSLKSFSLENISGRSCFSARLAYKYQEKDLLAVVTIVPAISEHYVMTYIDLESKIEQRLSLRDELYRNIVFSDASYREQDPDSGSQAGNHLPLSLSIFSIIVIFLLFARRISARKVDQ